MILIMSLWDNCYDKDELTFIDLCIGTVPIFLYEKIHSFVKNKNTTELIISIIIDNIFNDIKLYIWHPRCKVLIEKEKSLGITKIEKKKKNRTIHRLANEKLDRTNLILQTGLKGVEKSITLGESGRVLH